MHCSILTPRSFLIIHLVLSDTPVVTVNHVCRSFLLYVTIIARYLVRLLRYSAVRFGPDDLFLYLLYYRNVHYLPQPCSIADIRTTTSVRWLSTNITMVAINDGEMGMTRLVMYGFNAEIRHSIQATASKVRQHMTTPGR